MRYRAASRLHIEVYPSPFLFMQTRVPCTEESKRIFPGRCKVQHNERDNGRLTKGNVQPLGYTHVTTCWDYFVSARRVISRIY